MFKALGQFWSTFIAVITFGAVKFGHQNAEAVIAKRLQDVKEKRKTMIKAVALVASQKEQSLRAMNAAKTNYDKWNKAFQGAKATRNEVLGKQLYPKMTEAKTVFDQAEANYKQDLAKLENMQKQQQQLESTIKELQRRGKTIVADLKSAEAEQEVANLMAGINTDMPSFDDLEQLAIERKAQADATSGLLVDPDEALLQQAMAAGDDAGFAAAFASPEAVAALPAGTSVFDLPEAGDSGLEFSAETREAEKKVESSKSTFTLEFD